MRSSILRRGITVLVTVVVLSSLLSGLAVAQSDVGGTVTVEEGTTVSEVNAVGGAVIVHGTVRGDVRGAAGNVLITGTVEGDVNVAAGNVRITGHVDGDVSAGAGSVHLEEGATVNGNFEVGAGDVRIDGTIGGDARIGAETIRLGETAAIGGSLTYDGSLEGNRDAVAGQITHDRTLGATSVTELQPLVSWVFAIYAFVANLVLGAILLALFPRFSEGVAERATGDPLKTGLVGFGFVAIPLLLLALFVTIVGIPFALAGVLVSLVVGWVGIVYGRFALGVWLLSLLGGGQTDRVDRKWAALVLGLVVGTVLGVIPFVGSIANFVLFLLGLGALTLGVIEGRGGMRGTPPGEPTEASSIR